MKVFLTFLTLFFYFSLSSQHVWDYSFYNTIDNSNFREHSIFHQRLDFSDPDIPLLNAVVFFITNEERVKHNLPVVEYNSNLEIAAYNHSKSMVEDKFFSHINNVNSRRGNPRLRGELAGIKNPKIAEIILYNYVLPGETYINIGEGLVDMWMNSKTHRDIILSDQGIQSGCGVYFKGDQVFATQKFQWYDKVQTKEASDKLPPVKKE